MTCHCLDDVLGGVDFAAMVWFLLLLTAVNNLDVANLSSTWTFILRREIYFYTPSIVIGVFFLNIVGFESNLVMFLLRQMNLIWLQG